MIRLPALAASLLLPLAIAGCATVTDAPIVDGGPVRSDAMAHLGEPTQVGSLVVTPMQIVEDSRCADNARCIWAGRVVLTTRVDGAGWRETVNLVLGEPQAMRGTRIALVSAQPGRATTDTVVAPEDYEFGFEGG